MHRHSFELIAEYAQGTLADETRAMALVSGCDRCRQIYDQQRLAVETLASVLPAELSEYEKATLHRDIWTQLTSTPAADKTASSPWWRTSWAFGAAAVLLIGVGLFGFLNMPNDIVGTFSEVGAGLSDGGGDMSAQDVAPAGEESGVTSAPTGELDERASLKTITEDVRSGEGSTSALYAAAPPADAESEAQRCLQRAGFDDLLIVEGFEDLVDLIVAVPPNRRLSTTPVIFVDPESCRIVYRED